MNAATPIGFKYFHILFEGDIVVFKDGATMKRGIFTGKRIGELALKQEEYYELVLENGKLGNVPARSVKKIINYTTGQCSYSAGRINFNGLFALALKSKAQEKICTLK